MTEHSDDKKEKKSEFSKTPMDKRSAGYARSQSVTAHTANPTAAELRVIELLTRELVNTGDFRIRFVERLEEEFPTLLVYIALPRGIQAGDPEVFQLHEIANQLSESNSIDIMITTASASGRGRKLEYESAEIAINIGSDVLNGVPNFLACAAILRSSMRGLSVSSTDAALLLKNIRTFAEVCFHLGRKDQAYRFLSKHKEILGQLQSKVAENYTYASLIFADRNEAALLQAKFGDFDEALASVDLNFEKLRNFVDETKILNDPARMAELLLPKDLTFARQDLREKIQFLKDRNQELPEICQSALYFADVQTKRILDETKS